MIRIHACSIALIFMGGMWGVPAGAHSLTLAECTEGGEFIRNAALARDNGITREFFINKMSEDLAMIQTYPPAMRWFVQDAGDEKLLSDAVFKVFDEPVKAEQHEASFVRACLRDTGSGEGQKI